MSSPAERADGLHLAYAVLDKRDAEADLDGLRRLTRSYASACAVLRHELTRATLLGSGPLEFNEMTLTPTIDGSPVTPEMLSRCRELAERTLRGNDDRRIQFSRENLELALLQVAREQTYHPVREYLNSLSWDRRERLSRLVNALGAPGTDLNTALLRKFMLSAVARALSPGCKVDTTLILVGPQGVGKSRFFQELAGAEWFSDTPMTVGDKDSLLVLRSAWIHEWAELESAQRAARAQAVKAFLSSCVDLFRAPYERTPRPYPRACVIVGTTNDEEFLTDPTGGRRYWTVPVTRRVDVNFVRSERDQLWAEAVAAYANTEPWWLDEEQENQLREVQQRHEVQDPWAQRALDFAEANPSGVTTAGILSALDVRPENQTRAAAMRVAAILTRANYQRVQRRTSSGDRAWFYVRDTTEVVP